MPNVAEQLQLTDPSNTAASVSRLIADALSSYSSGQLDEYPKLRRMSTMPGAVTRQAPMPTGIGPVSGKIGPPGKQVNLIDVVENASRITPALFAKVEGLLGRKDMPISSTLMEGVKHTSPWLARYSPMKTHMDQPAIEFASTHPLFSRELRGTPVSSAIHEVGHARHNLEAVIEPERWLGQIYRSPGDIPYRVSPQVIERAKEELPDWYLAFARGANTPTELGTELIARKSVGMPRETSRLFIRRPRSPFAPMFKLQNISHSGNVTTLGTYSTLEETLKARRGLLRAWFEEAQ